MSILFFLAHGPLRARADMCVADGCAVGYCACLLFGFCMSALRFLCIGFVHVLSCANNLKEVCLLAPGYSMFYISNHMLATCRHVCIIWYDGGYRVHICTSHAQWNAKKTNMRYFLEISAQLFVALRHRISCSESISCSF